MPEGCGVLSVMPIVGLFHRRSVFNECMESRGYKKAE